MLLPIIKTIALARGLSRELALTAVMVTGIANASGRVISAWLSDRVGRTATVIALCLVTCGASLWMNIAVGIPYIIAVFLIAFAYGGPSGIFPPLVREVFGSRHAGTNFGMVLMALGASSLVFSRVSGSPLGGRRYLRRLFRLLLHDRRPGGSFRGADACRVPPHPRAQALDTIPGLGLRLVGPKLPF